MRKNRALRVLKIVLFAVVAGSFLSFVVMHLWNWLMPALFGLRLIKALLTLRPDLPVCIPQARACHRIKPKLLACAGRLPKKVLPTQR